ncbi:MAG: hypothetical protein AAGK37_21850 [Pseudomonadota bacterium]
MPVPVGTWVEVATVPPHPPATDGITQMMGFAGIDFVNSWCWTPKDRGLRSGLPIDMYRVWVDGDALSQPYDLEYAPIPP